MDKINTKIAKKIILAQIASDGGKRLYRSAKALSKIKLSKIAYHEGYAKKDQYLLAAIKGINAANKSSCGSEFHYYIARCYDFNALCVIVYFNFKIDGKRFQISFHSFNPKLWKLSRNTKMSQNHKVRWDKKSSYNAAMALYEIL